MSNSDRNSPEDELDRLRQALAAEARRGLELERQLDRANVEFEEFVSMAAHNLREPLRDVASFGQLMAETYGGRLDADAGLFLERIGGGAARMDSLLADIVDYWAARTSEILLSRTDMEAVFNQVLLSTDRLIRERDALVTHDPLPAVMGDFETLSKVLRHLIRNAINYCETPSPRIHLSSRRADLEWVLSVQDNGPGIEPVFQDRAFKEFKRLHGKDRPGSGLGLPFCRKAIERFGGRIWMESTPGAGSTFYFTAAPVE